MNMKFSRMWKECARNGIVSALCFDTGKFVICWAYEPADFSAGLNTAGRAEARGFASLGLH
jgi:hypothetical protein